MKFANTSNVVVRVNCQRVRIFWNFACLLGADEASAEPVHPQQLTERINTLVADGAIALFISIEPKATARVYKNVAEPWSPDGHSETDTEPPPAGD